jgi:FkbM family methyltransferase
MPALMQILQRAQTAFNKLLFCYRVAATPASFVQLLLNTKKAKWPKNNPALYENSECIAYHLHLHNNRYTFHLRTYAGDIQIFYDIFWRSIYQLPAPLFSQAKTIVDLGAHVGLTAAYFNMHCPQATVYCIEADENNYDLLTKNLQPAIANGKTVPLHAAITDKNALVYIQKSARSYNSQLADTITNFPVKGIRMEQFLEENHLTHIDIIKIDIEGAEAVLFNDDTAWLAITDTILIEIHSEEIWQQFTATVTRYGFRIEKREFENESLYVAFKPIQ